jgi:hypothetical protein
MSLNHIILDAVPDDEKLDVKFGIVEADTMDISSATFTTLNTTDLNVSGEIVQTGTGTAILKDVQVQNLVSTVSANIGNSLVVNSFIRSTTGCVQAKASLFKSKPYLNSNTIGPQSQLQADEIVNGMLIFDDLAKTTFAYKTPYKGDFDDYLGLSGTQEYCFRFDMTIFANLSTGGTYTLECDAVSGVSINYAGTYTKALPHTTGAESTFTFVCCRQSDGTYIIYG